MEETLRLNLQFFSEEVDGEPIESDVANNEEETKSESVKESVKEEKKFTQADVDRIVKERLARAKKDSDDAEEKARLEEQGAYKELLDKANAEIESLKAEKAEAIRTKAISDGLLAKGLSAEEVIKYAKYVDATAKTDEELAEAIDNVYNDFVVATQAAIKEPSAGFGEGKAPEQKGDDEFGRDLFKRLGR